MIKMVVKEIKEVKEVKDKCARRHHCLISLSTVSCLLIFFTFLLSPFTSSAQVATVPMGGHVTSPAGELTLSLGQCATQTLYDTAVTVNVRTASITEGVLQPYLTFELNRIDGIEPLSCTLNLYPNPTTESFTLEADKSSSQLHYSLFTLSGQLLNEGFFIHQTSVNVSDLPSGHYMLRIEDKEKKQSNAYRVIKIR